MHNQTLDHKQTTKLYFERLSAGDLDGAFELLTEDATWQNIGTPELLPSAVTLDRKGLRRLFERMFGRLESGLKITLCDTIAEGDRVAVEFESSGDLRNGRRYRQRYHTKLVFRDGKIHAAREYLDTQHAHEVWFRE